MAEPQPASQLLRRNGIGIVDVWRVAPPPEPLSFEVAEQVEVRAKYEGYIDKQEREVERFREAEDHPLPTDIDYHAISGLPRESQDRLHQIRPINFGQAGRISGVRASDIAILHIHVEKLRRTAQGYAHELDRSVGSDRSD